jgi:hypothetical protein
MANEWKEIGSVRKGKTGNFYIKVKETVTLTAEDNVQLQDPRKKLTESVAAGRLTQEKADAIAAKIPEYIKYSLVLPPKA